jgi:spore coat polysaccharide biosynthesis protein SpsF
MFKKIAIRCDGDEAIGMGHVRRCLSLATCLQQQGAEVNFVLSRFGKAANLIADAGYLVSVLGESEEGFEGLKNFVIEKKINCLVVDERVYLTHSNLMELKKKNITIAIIDDLSDKRLAADLVFYPPIKQLEALSWDNFSGLTCVGWEWVILGTEFEQNFVFNAGDSKINPSSNIVVSLGSSDVCNLTAEVIEELDKVAAPFEINVVINELFKDFDFIKNSLKKSCFKHKVNVYVNPQSMKNLIEGSLFCITNFGVTAYEIASCGKFSLLLCSSEDHYSSAEIFEEYGFAKRQIAKVNDINLPEIKGFISNGVSQIIDGKINLEVVRQKTRDIKCGRGAKNIASKILSRVNE